MHVRMHNEFTTQKLLSGVEAEYIDTEKLKVENSIDHSEDDGGFREKSGNDYLEQQRLKHGN